MRKQLLVCLKLEKILTFPNTNNKRFYGCRSIPFFIYIVSVGKATFMMILSQMMDIL